MAGVDAVEGGRTGDSLLIVLTVFRTGTSLVLRVPNEDFEYLKTFSAASPRAAFSSSVNNSIGMPLRVLGDTNGGET